MEHYESSHHDVDMELALIRDLVSNLPGDRKSVSWALVGSMRYVTLLLRDARQHLQDMETEQA